jgi:hypothetical protein
MPLFSRNGNFKGMVTDPDGTARQTERMIAASTRAKPMAAQSGKFYHVYPEGYTLGSQGRVSIRWGFIRRVSPGSRFRPKVQTASCGFL